MAEQCKPLQKPYSATFCKEVCEDCSNAQYNNLRFERIRRKGLVTAQAWLTIPSMSLPLSKHRLVNLY